MYHPTPARQCRAYRVKSDREDVAVTIQPKPVKPRPGQESVWDYPRPPRLEPFVGSKLGTSSALTRDPIPSAPACSDSMGAGRTGAIGAGAVVTGIGAVGALTRVVITARAGAIGANTDCTRVGTVGALAGSALVVVHPVGRGMLPVHMPVVQVVHVVGV